MTTTTEYANLLLARIDELETTSPAALRNAIVCPECGVRASNLVTGPSTGDPAHVLVDSEVGTYVAVGCEGYWTVDPALLGLERGAWRSATPLA
jgi:hypothetical protein